MPALGRERFATWSGALGIGLRTVLREPVLGAKRLVLPVSYWRTAEFAFVLGHLAVRRGDAVVDLGSPKDLAVLLARRHGCRVTALDILESAITLSARYAAAQGVAGQEPGQVDSRVADGRALAFPDGSFGAAYSVSVLEHIPGEGDAAAVRELARVLRPGGRLAITVPFAQAARDTFVRRNVYEREFGGGEPVFFERHYDHQTLRSRLLDPSGLDVERLEIWGEPRGSGERLLHRLGTAGVLLAPLEPALSLALIDRVDPDSQRAKAAFVLLRKPGAP